MHGMLCVLYASVLRLALFIAIDTHEVAGVAGSKREARDSSPTTTTGPRSFDFWPVAVTCTSRSWGCLGATLAVTIAAG